MTEQCQSSIGSKFFHGGDILMKILKNFKIFEKMKIEKEITRRKNVKRRRVGACSTSYSSGNQVDGLPLVAIFKIFIKISPPRKNLQQIEL